VLVRQCVVMPSGSPPSTSGGVTSSHHHYQRHHHHLATTVTSSSNSAMSSTGQHQQMLSRTNLYIRGLKPETTDKDLITLCQQCVLTQYIPLYSSLSLNEILKDAVCWTTVEKVRPGKSAQTQSSRFIRSMLAISHWCNFVCCRLFSTICLDDSLLS